MTDKIIFYDGRGQPCGIYQEITLGTFVIADPLTTEAREIAKELASYMIRTHFNRYGEPSRKCIVCGVRANEHDTIFHDPECPVGKTEQWK